MKRYASDSGTVSILVAFVDRFDRFVGNGDRVSSVIGTASTSSGQSRGEFCSAVVADKLVVNSLLTGLGPRAPVAV